MASDEESLNCRWPPCAGGAVRFLEGTKKGTKKVPVGASLAARTNAKNLIQSGRLQPS